MNILTLTLVLSLSLFSCSTLYKNSSWPSPLPPKYYFIDYYSYDKEHQKVLSLESYLVWIQRFYLGWKFYDRGWLKVTNEVSTTLKNKEDKKKSKEIMLKMGNRIAPEWAKNYQYRVINTRHLGIWGNAINQSIVNSEQLIILEKINRDVDALLDRTITPTDIADDRYYSVEDFDIDF